jgi:Ca2+-binding RTX toxin-like protein
VKVLKMGFPFVVLVAALALLGEDSARGMNGGPGEDELFGGTGKDELHADDGDRDVVNCGAGSDVAIADRGDRVMNCERVHRS